MIFPGWGAALMAIAIMVSTFGCINGLILAGPRVCYSMAHDGLFPKKAGELNRRRVPGWSLLIQGLWSAALVLPRTYNPKRTPMEVCTVICSTTSFRPRCCFMR